MKEILIELRSYLINVTKNATSRNVVFMCNTLFFKFGMGCEILWDSGLADLWVERGHRLGTHGEAWTLNIERLARNNNALMREKIECLNIIINRLEN